ncbi:MAG TPA: hypothetical protein VK468_04590 [Pyrinomonadaceae bacterium]|nr:hypothetical protein [Pyrinomonadaceae bacterium]
MPRNLKTRTFALILFTVMIVFKNYVIVIGQDTKPQKADDAAETLAVVNKLFDRMAAADPAGIVALHIPQSQLVAVINRKDGKSMVETFDVDRFSKLFTDKSKAIAEQMYAPDVKVDGDLAIVTGRYVFFIGAKLSHCGVDSFYLVRTDAGWKIAGGASTIAPGGCTDAEKAMKSPIREKS